MIVYVESNFVIELAAQQEERAFCERLLELAEAGEIRLVVPAFSIAEPVETFHRRRAKRNQLQKELGEEIRLLGRSASFGEKLRQAAEVLSIMDESRRVEQEALDMTLQRVGTVGELIPLNAAVMTRAAALREEFSLEHPDAVVLASVLIHLESAGDTGKLFLQRDRKDFLNPDIKSRLQALGCEMIGTFQAGVGRITGSSS